MKALLSLAIFCLTLSGNAHALNPRVEMQTNFGNITIELYPDKAPKTVENFLKYVRDDFYKGTIFHRVINRFVIQGGGFTRDFTPKPALAPIPNEAGNGLTNEPGTLAMARAYDPNSATSQFFINLDSNKFLNHYKSEPDYYGYCVFGKVVQGMDIVKKIGALPTAASGPFSAEVPTQPVVIENVSIVSQLADSQPNLKGKSNGKTAHKLRHDNPRL